CFSISFIILTELPVLHPLTWVCVSSAISIINCPKKTVAKLLTPAPCACHCCEKLFSISSAVDTSERENGRLLWYIHTLDRGLKSAGSRCLYSKFILQKYGILF